MTRQRRECRDPRAMREHQPHSRVALTAKTRTLWQQGELEARMVGLGLLMKEAGESATPATEGIVRKESWRAQQVAAERKRQHGRWQLREKPGVRGADLGEG